jgi:hypothetical protein
MKISDFKVSYDFYMFLFLEILVTKMTTIAPVTSPKTDTEKGPLELNIDVANGGKTKVAIFIMTLFVPNTFPLFVTGVMSQIKDVEAIAIAPAPKPRIRQAAVITR